MLAPAVRKVLDPDRAAAARDERVEVAIAAPASCMPARSARSCRHGVGLRRGVEQPERGGGVRIAGRAPHDGAAVHGARHRDVEEPELLGQLLAAGLDAQRAAARGRSELQRRRGRRSAGIVAHDVVLAVRVDRANRRPSHTNGQKTTGYSSPLLLWTVTILTTCSSLSSRSCCSSLSGCSSARALRHPLHQRIEAARMARRLVLEQLAQMQQVGQAALAVGVLEEARRHALALEQLAEHAAEAVIAPREMVVVERLEPPGPGAIVVQERDQLLAGDVEQLGAERGAHHLVASRVGDRRAARAAAAPPPGSRTRCPPPAGRSARRDAPAPSATSRPWRWLRTSTAMSPPASFAGRPAAYRHRVLSSAARRSRRAISAAVDSATRRAATLLTSTLVSRRPRARGTRCRNGSGGSPATTSGCARARGLDRQERDAVEHERAGRRARRAR